jgi:hypothetical protein
MGGWGIKVETGWEGVEWIHPTQDMDPWHNLGNTVMNFQFLNHRTSCPQQPKL